MTLSVNLAAGLLFCNNASAQNATIGDAWWSGVQDCDGDGCYAGTLAGNYAQLNWFPDVTNCSGSLTVFETVSTRPCGTSTWTPVFTNAPHQIFGCSSLAARYYQLPMGSNCACMDYKIEIYRDGQSTPDYIRSSTNDVQLSQHKEELLSQDICASDTFATCSFLAGGNGFTTENNSSATKEVGEPNHAGNPGGHSLWFCWTAPTNRTVTFDTIGSTFDTLLAIYTGSSVGGLTLVTNNDDIAAATNRMSKVTFTPVTGTTYRIAVDGFGGATGNAQLNWNQSSSALPDLIIWSQAVAPYITNTTLSACEISEGCASTGPRRLIKFAMETRNIGTGNLVLGNPATNPLFYWASCHAHWHFESFAQYTLLDTNGAPVVLGTNVVVGRKSGFCVVDGHGWLPGAPSSALYNCANQGLQAGWADVYSHATSCQFMDVTGVPAGSYVLQLQVNPDRLMVEANYDNNLTLIPITIADTNCVTPPANNDFSNAMPVNGTPFNTTVFNGCATKQSGEPNHAGNAGGASVWFNWTPTSSHAAVISTKGSDFDTTLGVYTGNAVNALSLVASNDDIVASVNIQSQVSFNAIAGTTYRIAVDGYRETSGVQRVGTINITIDPPGNDAFASAYLITGTAGSTNGTTFAATKETSETAHDSDIGGHSIWYRWNAPKNGFVDFNTLGSDFDTTLAIYTNSILTTTNLPVASNNNDIGGAGLQTSHLWFFAKAGTNYWIAVDGFSGDFGNVKLNWNMNSALSITNLPDGNVQIDLTGVDWQRYVLLGSTNLATWFTNTAAITMAGGSHTYTNTLSPTNTLFNQQFYRGMLVP